MSTILKMLAGAVLTILGGALYVGWRLVNPERVFVEVNVDVARRYEQVWFRSAVDRLLLHGLYMKAAPSAPHIIVCHGYTGNLTQNYGIARQLHDLGYGVLLLDFRGSGLSARRNVTLGRLETRDLAGAVEYLRGRLGAEAPIGVLGYSMGGAVAILVAAENREIAAVVTDSGFARLDAVIQLGIKRLPTRLARSFGNLSILMSELLAGGRVRRVRPLDAVGRLAPTPLLIIHGMEDTQISYEDALALYEHAREPKEIWLVEGVGHGRAFEERTDPYVDRVHRFFQGALVEHEAAFGPAV